MKLETSSSVAIPVEPKAGSKSASQNQGLAKHPSLQKRKTKKKRRHGSRAQQRRKQKWQRSRFRSRTDLNDRYVPQTVILKKASPIDDVELSVSSTTPKKSGKKKLLKEPTRNEGPKALKKLFKSVFATMVLTTSSLEGYLGRATALSKPEIEQLIQQIGLAVSTVNSAKHLVYKLIEMRILRPLLNTVSENQENGLDMNFLDKILNSDWAERFIQNLMSFVLRNSTASQGRKPSKEESKDAAEEAISTFDEFKRTLCPEFKALNASDLALSNIIAELAPKVSLDLKLHYRRLTETLKTKLLTKLSMDCSGLPTTGQDGTEAGVDAAAAGRGCR
ncbi:hypothetical protein FBU30_001550 [Linnemannia zychae]|nr:hypothetical protein FBU30_001550 [Linnemannia zychae]